jgi:hypothetical protein
MYLLAYLTAKKQLIKQLEHKNETRQTHNTQKRDKVINTIIIIIIIIKMNLIKIMIIIIA